jgi:hypothetical protein
MKRDLSDRLDRLERAMERHERLVRSRRHRCAVFAVVGTFFLVFALGGLVSEFIGAYWGPFR